MTAAARPFPPRPSRRPLIAALAAVLCIDALTAMVVLAYGNAYLLQTLAASSSAPAFALSAFGVVKLLTAPLVGRMVDRARAGTVLALIAGTELGALAVILLTHSAPGYFVGVGLLAAGIGTSWIVVIHALGEASAVDQRGSVASSMSLVSAGATGGGFGLAAVIAETGPWWLPFALGIALAAGSVALLRPRAPRAAKPAAAAAQERRPPSPAPADAPVPAGTLAAADATADPIVDARLDAFGAPDVGARIAAAAVVFGHFAIVNGLLVVFWPFTLQLLGLSPLHATLLLLPAGATGGAALVLSGRWSRPGRRLPQAAALYGVGAAGLVATAVATNAPWFAAAAVLVAPALAGAQPVLIASMIDISRSAGRSGAALGWIFSAEALGAIAGPAAVGVAIEVWDVRAGVIAIAVGAAALAVLGATASRVARL